MPSENRIILNHYIKLTEFLGRVLGPDYEVVLHDLSSRDCSIIAIANSHISGRSVGAPLTNLALQIIADKSYLASDYRLHYRGRSQDGKRLRSSTLFIKNSRNDLVGMLCINFSDQRFQDLRDQLMGLCHPDAFVETNFQFTVPPLHGLLSGGETPAAQADDSAETFHNTTDDVTRESALQIIRQMARTPERLTVDEKMSIVARLNASGAFLLKGAIKSAAGVLHCSPATIYRYLSRIRQTERAGGERADG